MKEVVRTAQYNVVNIAFIRARAKLSVSCLLVHTCHVSLSCGWYTLHLQHHYSVCSTCQYYVMEKQN
ncbi:hypothetical protein E2C01_025016 [Portunus trituberculatus]|uniref:Uncharacterized protein n=1 Tax=Portunus trituberculatus TaxID=210409 RepID=A0A5B7EEH9_PORTR|nr:hypothetical protein [Portunus trituberculatus]